MRFWDSSAVVPLLSDEPGFEIVVDLLNEDDEQTVWWGTWAECSVAISRLKRERFVSDIVEQDARVVLNRLASEWTEIEPSDDLRLLASLLSKDRPLKTADSLQLAAALRWREGETAGASIVCFDRTLRRAATDEGFDALPEAA